MPNLPHDLAVVLLEDIARANDLRCAPIVADRLPEGVQRALDAALEERNIPRDDDASIELTEGVFANGGRRFVLARVAYDGAEQYRGTFLFDGATLLGTYEDVSS